VGRYIVGARGAQRHTSGTKKYGRNMRPKKYPLMPDGLTVAQAQRWFTAAGRRV
jgi:hypothetical protein